MKAMKERPILFSAPMVRAILDGRKSMTRRVVDRDLWDALDDGVPSDQQRIETDDTPMGGVPATRFCKYGQPGDRLWVRETWAVAKPWDNVKPKDLAKENDEVTQLAVDYKADKQRIWGNTGTCGKTRPSIFMPRWASRITLEIISVRVEQVKDISAGDAISEGIRIEKAAGMIEGEDCYMMTTNSGYMRGPGGAIAAFRNLWDSINDARGYGWDVNPWVWVIEFRRVTL
jgi:hypothetical protein